MPRPHIVTSSPSDREQQLRLSEQEVATFEAQLGQEVSKLQSAGGEVLGRLQHVKAAAAQAQLQGVREPGFSELYTRIHDAAVGQLDVSAAWDASLKAREAAVEARRQAVNTIHQSLQIHAAELSRLASQLAADEVALTQIEARAREAAALREAQMRAESATLPVAAGAQPSFGNPPPFPQAPANDAAATPVARPSGRRALSRVRMQAAVDLYSDTNFFTGFSTNISEGGLFVATVACPPIGTEIDLSFTLGDQKVSVKGVVKWTREVNDRTPEIFPGVGVQFLDLDQQTADSIYHFVSAREPMFFPE